MADNTAAEVAEVPEVIVIKSDETDSDAPSQPQTAHAPSISGKRAMSEDDADEDDSEMDDALPPRKKARTSLAKRDAPEEGTLESAAEEGCDPEGDAQGDAHGDAHEDEIMEGVDETHEDLEDDTPDSTKPSSVNGKSSSPDADVSMSSRQAEPEFEAPKLRTSFSKSAAPRLDFALEMHNPISAEDRSKLETIVRERLQAGPMEYRKRKCVVNPFLPEYIVGNTWLEVWRSIIDKWCNDFAAFNQAKVANFKVTSKLLKSSIQKLLHPPSVDATPYPTIFTWITKNQLRNPHTSRLRRFDPEHNKPDEWNKQMKREAREAMLLADQRRVQTTLSFTPINAGKPHNDAQATSAATPINGRFSSDGEEEEENEYDPEQVDVDADMEDGEINSADASGADMQTDEEGSPVPQSELDKRHHYFPGIADDATFCLTCAQLGHTTDACPELTCKFCQGHHFKYRCPTRQRCTKCKQLGHSKDSCKEKLAVAPGEAVIECAICEGSDHTEIDCIQLYQRYRPQPGNVKKVRQLCVWCYTCGIEGHFGGDCTSAGYYTPPTKTWTMTTASLYVDPSSVNIALAYQNPLPPPIDVQRPNIPGRSIVPQTHVVYEMDDDDGGDLLAGAGRLNKSNNGKRAKGNYQPKGKKNGPTINIASNFTFNGAGAQPGPSHVLPPRPPPPGKPPGGNGGGKKQKGPAQQPKKNKNNGQFGEALPGSKPNRPENHPNNKKDRKPRQKKQNHNQQTPVSFTGVRTSQGPPPGQGGGGHHGGGGDNNPRGGGRGGKRPRQRKGGRGGGGGGDGGGKGPALNIYD